MSRGKEVKKLREKMGMNRREFSDYYGIPYRTVQDWEAEKRELPKPSSDIKGAAYIHIWMPYFRNNIKEIYVKKTVTIPQWLDILAKGKKVNFSAAMVRGIKEELGIENR